MRAGESKPDAAAEVAHMEKLTSRKNPYVVRLRALAGDAALRRERGETVLDGVKLLGEALDSGAALTGVLCSGPERLPAGLRCPVYEAPPELVAYASPVKKSPGPVFSLRMPEIAPPPSPRHALVLEDMQDPGNVGTLIRTANALGIECVLLAGDCADELSPRAVRASMGAAFRQYVRRCSLRELAGILAGLGLPLYGAALREGAADLRRVDLGRAAVAVGNEGHGLSEALLGLCDGTVIIPMRPGSESLNAAAAGAVLMWEMARSGPEEARRV